MYARCRVGPLSALLVGPLLLGDGGCARVVGHELLRHRLPLRLGEVAVEAIDLCTRLGFGVQLRTRALEQRSRERLVGLSDLADPGELGGDPPVTLAQQALALAQRLLALAHEPRALLLGLGAGRAAQRGIDRGWLRRRRRGQRVARLDLRARRRDGPVAEHAVDAVDLLVRRGRDGGVAAEGLVDQLDHALRAADVAALDVDPRLRVDEAGVQRRQSARAAARRVQRVPQLAHRHVAVTARDPALPARRRSVGRVDAERQRPILVRVTDDVHVAHRLRHVRVDPVEQRREVVHRRARLVRRPRARARPTPGRCRVDHETGSRGVRAPVAERQRIEPVVAAHDEHVVLPRRRGWRLLHLLL